ncbi:hypothetical protein BP6252_11848 [Coleophoma cylindrospora]|uniref:Zn(2)-C6 fungal-type domain-containing protein n=1 Tax=Coleophoma cylindrospora TaxID=1849047 RepID=A0A3D8QKS2_9HELO|nr:hypothetical protein BP6252_11848 [Coleophoma cylindrospora]
MPKVQQQTRNSRQRPVSCRFCRSRKLRCSREHPCSNCVSRGVACELETPARPPSGTAGASESELLERIRKLERLVESQKGRQNEPAKLHHPSPGTTTQPVHSSIVSPENETLDTDIAYLESIYNNHELPQHKILSNKLVFKICPIAQITNAPAYINHATSSCEPVRCIWMPQYSEAKVLLEKFVQDIDHIHHIVHTPSLPDMLSRVYTCLSVPDSVTKLTSGLIFLFLGIFACVTNLWTHLDCYRGLFAACADANIQALLWVKALEDLLDIVHRTMGTSMEGIQGITIAASVMLHVSGFSRRCKALSNMALLLARDAGLHVLDHPSNADSANLARTEIGRRLWWHLAASDWQAPARFDAAVRGVYHCHPRQMIVRKPMNLNDEDLVDGMSQDQKPLSWPTMMSYPLQRIRVAEIMRSLMDRNPLIMSDTGGLSHDIIMDVDTELQLFINDIPPFFSMTKVELEATYQLSPLRAISIVYQGFCLHSLTWAQRCKLHFPYFSRGSIDHTYAASRDVCLHSARQVIKTETLLSSSELFTATRYKFLGLVASVFMASVVVLLMDINHNKSSTQRVKLSGEILDAIRILEHVRHESETAAKFLESLMRVVRKHKVCKAVAPVGTGLVCSDGADVFNIINTQPAVGLLPPITPTSMSESNEVDGMDIVHERPESGEDLSVYFNELAQSFEQGVDVGSFDWDSILSGLESSMI